MATPTPEPAGARPARVAVLVHFLAVGTGLGIWASRLPDVKRSLGLHDGDIGFVVFLAAVGAVLALRIAGRVIERFGSRRTTQIAGIVVALSWLVPAAAGSLTQLGLSLLVIGAGSSLQDVAMNSQAVAIEHRLGQPIMSSFHAAFSVGGIVGAGIGALTAKLDIAYTSSFVGVSAGLLVAIVLANRWLLDTPETERRPREVERDRSRLPNRPALLALGAVGFVSFVAEGAATDWTTIYLRDDTDASTAIAALGFVVFSAAMTVGRLSGDALAARYGSLPLVRLGTAVAGVGLTAALAVNTTAAGLVGVAVFGIGLSTVVPQVFSAAGGLAPARAAAALSTVSSISYLGFLAGPALLGAVAQRTSVRVALFIPAVLVLAGSVLASRLQSSGEDSASDVGAGAAQGTS